MPQNKRASSGTSFSNYSQKSKHSELSGGGTLLLALFFLNFLPSPFAFLHSAFLYSLFLITLFSLQYLLISGFYPCHLSAVPKKKKIRFLEDAQGLTIQPSKGHDFQTKNPSTLFILLKRKFFFTNLWILPLEGSLGCTTQCFREWGLART